MENTSAVSARASDLSTMMSSFSPLSRILSMDERGEERDTDVVDHDALDVIELLLDSSGDIGVGIVPLGLRIIAGGRRERTMSLWRVEEKSAME